MGLDGCFLNWNSQLEFLMISVCVWEGAIKCKRPGPEIRETRDRVRHFHPIEVTDIFLIFQKKYSICSRFPLVNRFLSKPNSFATVEVVGIEDAEQTGYGYSPVYPENSR